MQNIEIFIPINNSILFEHRRRVGKILSAQRSLLAAATKANYFTVVEIMLRNPIWTNPIGDGANLGSYIAESY